MLNKSSSSYVDNLQNNFLIQGKGPTFGRFGSAEKKFKIFLINKIENSVSVYIIMQIKVICLLMGKKYLTLKLTIKMITF